MRITQNFRLGLNKCGARSDLAPATGNSRLRARGLGHGADPTRGRLRDDSQPRRQSGALAKKRDRPFLEKRFDDSARMGQGLLAPNLTAVPPISAEAPRGSRSQDPHAEIKRRLQKTPELSLRGCQFQPIGMRSEVTGDAETALETVAVAFPLPRNERAGVEDRPDKRVGSFLADGLIH
jgi:hypothetical protein